MELSRHSLAPWWPAAWLATSALLAVALSQIETGWFLAVLYLGLNACTVGYVVIADDAPRSLGALRTRRATIVGWCAAVQLPVMLWLFSNARRAPERFNAQRLAEASQRTSDPPRR